MEKSNKVRVSIFIGLAILVTIFLIQNAAVVVVQLYFWPISIPRSLLIIISLGLGALGNYIFLMRNRNKVHRKSNQNTYKAEPMA